MRYCVTWSTEDPRLLAPELHTTFVLMLDGASSDRRVYSTLFRWSQHMYQKPSLEKFGTFRDLTPWGFSSATDGGSIFGIGSPGCQTTIRSNTYSIGCPTTDGPTSS